MAIYNSPLVMQQADPYVLKHEGKYYFTATCPLYDRIELRVCDKLNDIATAKAKTIWVKHKLGIMSGFIWAPEIHYIMGKWVIYFAASKRFNIWRLRPYALVCDSQDPMTGNWSEATMTAADDDKYSFTEFSLDMTVFENKGKWFTVWAEKVKGRFGLSNLYIAELETPTKLKSVQVLLSTPDYDWERIDFWVNEGANVLHHNGKLFLTFSASATGAMYCMGMMSADENSDLLDPTSWKKRNKPVLTTNEQLGVYGPGHNCFVKGDEDEDLCMLHFRNYEKIKGDPLNDHNRHAHVIKIRYDENDEPVFEFNKDELYNVPVKNEFQKGINEKQ